jgi:hypothetical protein
MTRIVTSKLLCAAAALATASNIAQRSVFNRRGIRGSSTRAYRDVHDEGLLRAAVLQARR